MTYILLSANGKASVIMYYYLSVENLDDLTVSFLLHSRRISSKDGNTFRLNRFCVEQINKTHSNSPSLAPT